MFSRIAQRLLAEAGVTLALRVKAATMQRLSRFLRTPIAYDTYFEEGFAEQLGVCREFSVESMHNLDAVPEGAATSSGGGGAAAANSSGGGKAKAQTKATFMFFRDEEWKSMDSPEPPSLAGVGRHSTIMLRGGALPELKAAKNALRSVLLLCANMQLEHAFFLDSCITYGA